MESSNTGSQFPRDLQTVNDILDMSVNFLIDDLTSDPNTPVLFSVVSVARKSQSVQLVDSEDTSFFML